MREIVKMLREFHAKQRFKLDVDLQSCASSRAREWLEEVTADLKVLAKDLEKWAGIDGDLRLHRAQLMVEEVGETIEAMVAQDEVALVDGLSDALFVTIGTSESFGLPTRPGLVEICKSNLTKDPRSDADVRLRRKGPNYVPPDVQRVLGVWRAPCSVCHAQPVAPDRDTCIDCSH